MSKVVKYDTFLYVNDSCFVCQHKDSNKFENQSLKDSNICDWFKVAGTDMRYCDRSKFLRSLVYKKTFGLI